MNELRPPLPRHQPARQWRDGSSLRAEDLTLGRKVALKFLPPQLSRDQNAMERFLLEARTASALNHPNICTIYAVETAPGETGESQSFIAMELLEGQNLSEKVNSGPLSPDRLLEVAIQLADALDAAHGTLFSRELFWMMLVTL